MLVPEFEGDFPASESLTAEFQDQYFSNGGDLRHDDFLSLFCSTGSRCQWFQIAFLSGFCEHTVQRLIIARSLMISTWCAHDNGSESWLKSNSHHVSREKSSLETCLESHLLLKGRTDSALREQSTKLANKKSRS